MQRVDAGGVHGHDVSAHMLSEDDSDNEEDSPWRERFGASADVSRCTSAETDAAAAPEASNARIPLGSILGHDWRELSHAITKAEQAPQETRRPLDPARLEFAWTPIRSSDVNATPGSIYPARSLHVEKLSLTPRVAASKPPAASAARAQPRPPPLRGSAQHCRGAAGAAAARDWPHQGEDGARGRAQRGARVLLLGGGGSERKGISASLWRTGSSARRALLAPQTCVAPPI